MPKNKKKASRGKDRPDKKLTNEQYAEEIAKVTKLTAAEINRMFPTHAEKDKLLRLLSIANSRLKGEEKAEELIDHMDTLADVILKLVRRCV